MLREDERSFPQVHLSLFYFIINNHLLDKSAVTRQRILLGHPSGVASLI